MKEIDLDSLHMRNLEVIDPSELLMNIDSLYNMSETLSHPEEQHVHHVWHHVDNNYGQLLYSDDWLESQGFREEQIAEIKKGISQKVAVERYGDECYNWMQMREIRLGLLAGVDTEMYENPYYSAAQMFQIRMGLADGLDAYTYASLSNTAKDMEKFRRRLMQEEYLENPTGYERISEDSEIGVRVRITDDCMEAYITLTKDGDFSVKELRRILYRNDVVYGLLDKQLEEVVEKGCCGEEIKVAQGRSAVIGTDGRYMFYFNPLLPGKPRELEDGSVDYTEIAEVERISKGEILAQYQKPTPGRHGTTVMGITVPGRPGKEHLPLTGRGFVINHENETYVSTMDGYAFADEEKGTLEVCDIYVVPGDVNRYNGHISYDGIVHIKGNVGDMAMIEATGNIVVEGTVESAYLIAGKNIILKKGINGAERGIIKAGRKVMGKFFEAVEVYAGDDVEGNYFMNCIIQTDGHVIAKGRKGRIMGGSIQALGGVEAMSIGNNSSNRTSLDVGNIMQIEDRRREVATKLKKIQTDLIQLEEGRNKLIMVLGEHVAKCNDMYQKTCQAYYVMEEQKKELENDDAYLDMLAGRALKAEVVAYGSLREDVKIMINGKRIEFEPSSSAGKRVIKREVKGE